VKGGAPAPHGARSQGISVLPAHPAYIC